ncbi:MAG: TerB family tellurite resistance protein [Gammaproteobacteria bacterium]
MFRTLKALIDDALASLDASSSDIDPLPLAVAALLLEIARADHEVDASEKRMVLAAITRLCEVDADGLDDLVATAGEAVDQAVSFYDFTNVVNERLSREQKIELLEKLWQVAQADGRVDHYEEYYIRRLSDLLHLSHGDFIRAKLAVLPG